MRGRRCSGASSRTIPPSSCTPSTISPSLTGGSPTCGSAPSRSGSASAGGRWCHPEPAPSPRATDVRRWLVGRIVQAAVTLAVALVLLFLLVHVLPGDPLAREGERALTPEQIADLRRRYGLDQPLPSQLAAFVGGLARGNLGTSIEYGRPVTALLLERLPATLLLGGAALVLNFTVGLWLGVRQAVRKDTREDRWLTTLSLAGYATPSFWLGLVLAGIVGVRWRLLPAAGMHDPLGADDFLASAGDVLRHLILPAATLSAVSIAGTMRYQRSAMVEVLRLPYIVTARAKGISERRVVWRHAW